MVEVVLLSIYGLLLFFILLYSFVQLNLSLAYRNEMKEDKQRPKADGIDWPHVTIQLPVYNELYVVERLIDCVAELDYPSDKLEIQVLDDGNDESVQKAQSRVAHWQSKGLDIKHIQREERVGYKAGALAYGLEKAKGEFTAIFDADFLPSKDFLKRTIPHFIGNDQLGVVQTRWEHINEDYSTLTRLQAFGLDAHFTVEQTGRNRQGHFINFNGTAGVWRNACIHDAGGWQHDTITEDLDLSYRAQLKGWKFRYLEEVGSPAELPAEMNALKSQQFRWTKGAAECAVKNLPKVLMKRGIGLPTKIHAIFHLMNSAVFVCILAAALLSLPILMVKASTSAYDIWFNVAGVFLISFFVLAFFYWTSRKYRGDRFIDFLRDFPLFLSVSMGLSLHNSIAVIEGYIGRKTPFVRTPKFAIADTKSSWTDKKYRALKANPITVVEALLSIYFIFAVGLGIYFLEFGLMPFHVMLAVGFGYVAWYSFKHTRVS